MNKRKKQKSISMGIGTSSIMMIFTVLCLTIFATLTLLEANSDLKKSEEILENTTAYYKADSIAQSKRIETLKIMLSDISEEEKQKELKDLEISIVQNELSYSVDISSNKTLEVTLVFENNELNIKRWQQVVVLEDDYGAETFVD